MTRVVSPPPTYSSHFLEKSIFYFKMSDGKTCEAWLSFFSTLSLKKRSMQDIEPRLRAKLYRDNGIHSFTTQDYYSLLLLPETNALRRKVQKLVRIDAKGEKRRSRSKKMSRSLRKGYLKPVNNPIGKGASQTEYVWVRER